MFSVPEMSRRLAATRAIVREERLDALVATEEADIRWLVPAPPPPRWSLIVPAVGDPALVASERLASRLRDLGVDAGAIGVVGSGREDLSRALPGALLRDVGASLWRRRATRSAEEIGVVRAAAALADAALGALCEGRAPDGDVTIGVARTSMRAPRATDPGGPGASSGLERGQIGVVTVEAGPLGYRARLERVFTAGEPPTPEFLRLHGSAAATHAAAVAAIRPGARLRDLGDGASIADGEALGPQTVLEAGMMVFVRAEAASADGRARVRVGDLHLVSADGAEPLQRFPLEIGLWR